MRSHDLIQLLNQPGRIIAGLDTRKYIGKNMPRKNCQVGKKLLAASKNDF